MITRRKARETVGIEPAVGKKVGFGRDCVKLQLHREPKAAAYTIFPVPFIHTYLDVCSFARSSLRCRLWSEYE